MSLKELLLILAGALLLVGVVVALLLFGLVYLESESAPGTDSHVECSEDDFSGLCGIKKFLRGERGGDASGSATIDL